ncbi:hypothetical protein F4553_001068 [Allocatelliglobosispora scoriae]|uniref:Phage holin family protein n=1 Tax=Allocatelliglobosispora scoriae TaxID=643052 RepID=A0A841BKH7_9ACTN|nr:phage holin family protein [Allocatelliglobosispora scoriae]MBB5867689.1 hypothetical protein [Allocatelliglobosispora scoriae]
MADDRMSELSTAELVQRAEQQLGALIRDEMRLVRAELSEKARSAGYGAGLLAGAAAAGWYAAAAALVGLGLGLAYAMPGWLAALVVAIALAITAGIAALLGRKKLTGALPPTPDRAIDSIRTDIETMEHAVKEREGR